MNNAVDNVESASQDVHLAYARSSDKQVELSTIIAALEDMELKPETVLMEV